MTAIACNDYIADDYFPIIPTRIDRTNPDAIRNRWANFIYSMDLSPQPGDEEIGNVHGAWSLGDLPVTHATQIDDDRGDDTIVVAIVDRVYFLDWTRFEDEWAWNSFKPIKRLLRIGPLPSNAAAAEAVTKTVTGTDVYALDHLKRFREVQFHNHQPPGVGVQGKWKVQVAEWGNEPRTSRSATYDAGQRMRAKIATKGSSFIVTLKHSANEPIELEHWQVFWDVLGRRFPVAKQS
jgi:hypothetical protein